MESPDNASHDSSSRRVKKERREKKHKKHNSESKTPASPVAQTASPRDKSVTISAEDEKAAASTPRGDPPNANQDDSLADALERMSSGQLDAALAKPQAEVPRTGSRASHAQADSPRDLRESSRGGLFGSLRAIGKVIKVPGGGGSGSDSTSPSPPPQVQLSSPAPPSAPASAPFTFPNLDALSPRSRARYHVIAEIINTERDYAKDLAIATEVYMTPMRESKVLPPEKIAHIFSNITTLVGISRQLASDLEHTAKESGCIGKPLVGLIPYLRLYSQYCSNQQLALDTIENARKASPAFAQLMQDQQSVPEARMLGLEGYLIKPTQRICRYPLFLKELMRGTPETHPDHADLEKARVQIEAVVSAVNEAKRRIEISQEIYHIQSRLDKPDAIHLMTNTRTFIKEGPMRQLCGTMDIFDAYFFLFNDLLLFTRVNYNKKYAVHARIVLDLAHCTVFDLTDGATPAHLKNAFELMWTDNGLHDSGIFFLPSAELKHEWLFEITSRTGQDLRRSSSPTKAPPVPAKPTAPLLPDKPTPPRVPNKPSRPNTPAKDSPPPVPNRPSTPLARPPSSPLNPRASDPGRVATPPKPNKGLPAIPTKRASVMGSGSPRAPQEPPTLPPKPGSARSPRHTPRTDDDWTTPRAAVPST